MKSPQFDHSSTICTNVSPMGCAAHRQAAFARLVNVFGRTESEYLGLPIAALRAEIARLEQASSAGSSSELEGAVA